MTERLMRRSLTAKIITSYILIIIISFSLTAVLFGAASRLYLERMTTQSLNEDAALIAEALKKAVNSKGELPENGIRQLIRENLVKSLKILDNNWFVVSRDFRVLYPSRNSEAAAAFENDIRPYFVNRVNVGKKLTGIKINTGTAEFIAAARQLPGLSGVNGANYIVIYSQVPTGQVREGILKIFMLALLVSAAIAIIFGIFFAKSVAQPILKLKKRAELLARRDFDTKVGLKTGDELEELSDTIDSMASELKAYDTAQKRFIQNASHELRTPLTSIRGYAEGLRDGVFDNGGKALEIIIDEAARLKRIVDELIYLSKLETMEDFYHFENISLSSILSASAEKIQSPAIIGAKRLKLKLDGDVEIKADRDKLVQAFINIMDNCIRHSENEVSVSTSVSDEACDILISDDGEGFAEDELNKVFERFYKGKKGNTGLGMAITKVIIEKHLGKIEVSNRSEGGAQFHISFFQNA